MNRSPIRPSSAYRLRSCPASPMMEASCPDNESIHATRGTAMHELAAECLVNGNSPRDYLGRYVIQGNPNVVDEEMVEYVQQYVDIVRGECSNGVLLVEQKLDFSSLIHIPESYGTADAVVFHSDPKDGHADVTIVDLKTGFERVDAAGSDQLFCYCAGVLSEFGADDQIGVFKIMIVQPSLKHVDSVIVTPNEVLAYMETLKVAARRAMSIKDYGASPEDFNPGEKQCRYCKAKGSCPALEKQVLDVVADTPVDVRKSVTEQLQGAIERAHSSDNAHIAECYSALPLVKSWVDAVESRAYRELQDGNELPGYKLVNGAKGVRRWSDERLVANALDGIADDVVYRKQLHTPKQIENLVNEGRVPLHVWQTLEPLMYQQRNKPQIAPINDKRPAIKTVAFVAQQHPNPTDILEFQK